MSVSVRLSPELNERLTALAARTHRSKSFYMTKALEDYLENQESYLLALEAYNEYLASGKKSYTSEEVREKLGLD